MLATLTTTIPNGNYLYEPKWDGFRALAFVSLGDDGPAVYLQSRDEKPLARYFPEVVAALGQLPAGVYDGEIVIRGPRGLDFGLLQLRLHPAASRIRKLSLATPAAFVAFDLLALGALDLTTRPQSERRQYLEQALAAVRAPIHLTPITRDPAVAAEWFSRFEGAGLDGIIAKPASGAYRAGQRSMIKVKHQRTADCVVAGFRWHKNGPGTHVGSLILALYDEPGFAEQAELWRGESDQKFLRQVGVAASFTMPMRKALAAELAPLREGALEAHPWRHWLGEGEVAEPSDANIGKAAEGTSLPGGQSRWSGNRDLRWEPLRLERVCEVRYDHLQGPRFRHATHFLRWRPDKQPSECTYAQLEVVAPAELDQILAP